MKIKRIKPKMERFTSLEQKRLNIYDTCSLIAEISSPITESASIQPAAQYVYNADNEITDDGTNTYVWDNNGNLISKTNKTTGVVTSFTWDYENRLIELQMPNGTIAQYAYDPFGRRIQKNVNGVITNYLYDKDEILMEYDQNGNVIRTFTHGLGIDQPLMVNANGGTYFYHTGALGSITAVSDTTGTMVQENIYDAFGNLQAGNNVSQYAFTGREYDAETGLYYYRARYYDPELGRFISKDPIGLRDKINIYAYAVDGGKPFSFDTNPYSYAGENPVNLRDPLGLFDAGEWLACQFTRPTYCQVKFGQPCHDACGSEYFCNDPTKYKACIAECAVNYSACLLGSKCPFEGPFPNAKAPNPVVK